MNEIYTILQNFNKVAEPVAENKERPYVCVHAKKGKYECTASSSYAAAKKAAEHWGLKSTAGIDTHLSDVEHVAEETVAEAVEFDPQEFEYIMDEIANLADQALGMLPQEERRAAEAYWYAHILGAIGGHHGGRYMGGSMHTMANSLSDVESGRDEDEDEAWESIERTAQTLLK
jgi:hypothetical protein